MLRANRPSRKTARRKVALENLKKQKAALASAAGMVIKKESPKLYLRMQQRINNEISTLEEKINASV
jgi:hypothetical protein